MASTYLSRTHGSNPTNTTKATVSCWVKKSGLDQHQGIFGVRNTGNNQINVQSGFFNGKWYMWYKDGSTDYYLQDSTAIPRDTNGWYHVVFRFDTTQGTAADRLRIYINGEDLGNSSFSTKSNPTQDDDIIIGTNGLEFSIGRYMFTNGSFQYFDGSISHFHYCDGYSYGPDSFGSTDSTTGEWKINTAPSVSYGNNGFFVLKDTNSGTDQSPNTNNLTVGGGTLTKTEDNPSNVFATLNRLYKGQNNLTISQGNTKAVEGSDNWRTAYSSLGASSGKFYCEAKVTYQNNTEAYVGVAHEDHINGLATFGGSWGGVQNEGYDYVGYSNKSVSIYSTGDQDYPSSVNVGDTWQSNGDIVSIAMDLDNNKVYFAKNGAWADGSGGWGSSTFNSSTGGQTIVSGLTFFGFSPNQSTLEVNFGNGYFGTTAVASAGTNASNIGIFEYNVPAGYTALCTKGLNE